MLLSIKTAEANNAGETRINYTSKTIRNTTREMTRGDTEDRHSQNTGTDYIIYLDDNNNSDKEVSPSAVETKPHYKNTVEFEPCFKFSSKSNEVKYFRNSKKKKEFSAYYSWNKSSLNFKCSFTPKNHSTTLIVFPKPLKETYKTEVTHVVDNRKRWSVKNSYRGTEIKQNSVSSGSFSAWETLLDVHRPSEQDSPYDTDSCDSEDIEVDAILRGVADDLYSASDVILEEEEMDITPTVDIKYNPYTNQNSNVNLNSSRFKRYDHDSQPLRPTNLNLNHDTNANCTHVTYVPRFDISPQINTSSNSISTRPNRISVITASRNS